MRVRLAQLLEWAAVELAEVHLAQVVEQDGRVARQRTDGLRRATGADERTRVQRVHVPVLAIEVVRQQLDLVLAALAEVGIGPARQAHADVVLGFGVANEQQGGGRRAGLSLHRQLARTVNSAPSTRPALSTDRQAGKG